MMSLQELLLLPEEMPIDAPIDANYGLLN